MKRSLLTQSLFCLGISLLVAFTGQAQAPESSVTKVTAQADGSRKTGTGFIVQLSEDQAYVVTAAHVVEGDNKPEIEFFTRRNAPVAARIVGLEGGDPKGLALLLVSGRANLPSGLGVLSLAASLDLKGGDVVTAIGFPRMAGPWAIIRGSIVSRQGREIIFDAAIDEGNSGGPLIKDGQAVGLITGVAGRYGRATPAASVRLFLDGWGVQSAQASQPLAPATPPGNTSSAPTATSRYPESAMGLTKLIEDILGLLQAGDIKAATLLAAGIARFDHDAWFREVFGGDVGSRLASSLGGSDMAAALIQTFSEQIEKRRTVVHVERFTGQNERAVGNQNRAMAAMRKPEPIYSVRLAEPGQDLGLHLYNFIFAQGGFRFVGKMQLPEPDGSPKAK